ncbi:hypothetical protein Mapa_012013 [Marchantia paleacea]|nr:hypothetical protein Mapa_012013 [Marchantia paleacea]
MRSRTLRDGQNAQRKWIAPSSNLRILFISQGSNACLKIRAEGASIRLLLQVLEEFRML